MNFRFIDRTGREQVVSGCGSLLELSEQGVLTPETLVFDEGAGRWRPAREFGSLTPNSPASSGPDREPIDVGIEAVEPLETAAEVPDPASAVPEAPPAPAVPHGDRRFTKMTRIIFAVDALAIIGLFVALSYSGSADIQKAAKALTQVFVKCLMGLAFVYFSIKG